MSLKIFHLIFISISFILAIGFGLWSLNSFTAQANAQYLVLGVLSFIFAVALVVYEVIFFKRTKNIHF